MSYPEIQTSRWTWYKMLDASYYAMHSEHNITTMSEQSEFHFPTEITLKQSPLVEAWLDIRWQLDPGESPDSRIDTGFAFALGVFYKSIKERYPYHEPLPTSFAPEDILPFIVRYRFRAQQNTWPLLQLGPGIATLNFTSPYTWRDFKSEALYLRNRLRDAYADTKLDVADFILHYRNAIDFNFLSEDLLEFLNNKLNTTIALPSFIPGSAGAKPWPNEINATLAYDLIQPTGKGLLKLGTGYQNIKDAQDKESTRNPVVIFELEVQSKNPDNVHWSSDEAFDHWLSSAHSTIHEWFFALIEGDLRQGYENRG